VPVIRRALDEAREATARRAAEAAQGRMASLLRTALESTAEGLLVVDLAGRISAYNRKFLTLCGIPEYVMAPMRIEGVIEYLQKEFGDTSALLDEVRMLQTRSDKEGSGFLQVNGNGQVQAFSRPQRLENETVGRVLSFQEPQRRESPPQLLKAIGATRSSLTEAALAVRAVPWTLNGDRLVIPEAGADLLGLKTHPADLAQLVDLFHPEDAQAFLEALERSQNVAFPARLRRRDGTWAWIRLSVDRGPEGYRGVIQDVQEEVWQRERETQRHRQEGARDATRRLLGKGQAIFAAALADLVALTPAPGHEHLLASALARLGDLEALMASMRTLATLGRPELAPVDPNAFMESFLRSARIQAGPEIEVSFEPAKDLPMVGMSQQLLAQALSALVANAKEAMAGGKGAIRLSTGLLYPRPYRPGGRPGPMRTRVYFEVADGGPGIPPGIRKKVFEPFFSTHLGRGHPGLGLTLAREIAEGHGGTLQLESAARGTVVRILLPLDL
jgi:signal transduction histidine kinase